MEFQFKDLDRKNELFRQTFWAAMSSEGVTVNAVNTGPTPLPQPHHLRNGLDIVYRDKACFPTFVFFASTYFVSTTISELDLQFGGTPSVTSVFLYERQSDLRSAAHKALYQLRRVVSYNTDENLLKFDISLQQSFNEIGAVESANLLFKKPDGNLVGLLNILSFLDKKDDLSGTYPLSVLATTLSEPKVVDSDPLSAIAAPIVAQVKWKSLVDDILAPGFADSRDLEAAIAMLKAELIKRRFNSVLTNYYTYQERISLLEDSFWDEKSLTSYVRSIKSLIESGKHHEAIYQSKIEAMLAFVEALNPNI